MTFELSLSQIPTRSHSPIKYLPKFALLCSPKTPLKPTTSECNDHFPSFTSIQCTVIPKNNTFVLLAVHLSAVEEVLPGAFWVAQVSAIDSITLVVTYRDIHFQLR